MERPVVTPRGATKADSLQAHHPDPGLALAVAFPESCTRSFMRNLKACFCVGVTAWSVASLSAAMLTVTSTNDNGPGSLRQAIVDASSGDRINFAVTGTITLTNGEMLITNNLTISGPGASQLGLSGGGLNRVLHITNGTVEVSGLTIVNGASTNGGGIYNEGSLTLRQCTLATNLVRGASFAGAGSQIGDSAGGGVFNAGTLVVLDSVFVANSAVGGSGFNIGPGSGLMGGGGFGGAIYNAGLLTVTGTAFSDNSAVGGLGGQGARGFYYISPTAGWPGGFAGGGAIYDVGSSGTIANTTFAGNSATGGHGGDGGDGFQGYCGGGTPQASAGASGGPGGDGDGGSIYHSTGTLSVLASTFSGSTATGGAGGNGGVGGPCFEGVGHTPSGGPGSFGSGLGAGLLQAGANGVTSIRSTLVAQNSSSSWGADLAGTFNSGGHNLIGQVDGSTGLTNGANGDLAGNASSPLDPGLGPLQNNRGPTFTMALLPGSPAIDAGDDALLGLPFNLATDQRGLPRRSGTHVDIGAFEFQMASVPLAVAGLAKLGNGALQLTFSNSPGATFTVLASTNGSLPLSNWPALGVAAEIAPGQFQFTDTQAATRPSAFYRVRSP